MDGFSECRIIVMPSACFLGALLLLLVPMQWLLGALLAAAVHEFFHILAIRLMGKHIFEVRIDARGACIVPEPLTAGEECISALAGPVGALSLLLAAGWFPTVALCAFFQSVFNLIPIYPLDGGRALLRGAELFVSEKRAVSLSRLISFLTGLILTVFLLRFRLFLPVLILLMPVMRRLAEKYLAKKGK